MITNTFDTDLRPAAYSRADRAIWGFGGRTTARMRRSGMSSQQLYDLDALRRFLRETTGVTGPIEVTGRAPGGSSNITLYLEVDGERWVLRRPPSGELLPTSHDMLREYRFLRAIHGPPVPVPEP